MPDVLRSPCPVCGELVAHAAQRCHSCGHWLGASPGALRAGVATGGWIPYRNVPALLAYYLGVGAILPCCFPLGLPAFILGLIGLRHAKQDPAVRGEAHAWFGIIVGGGFGLLWTVGLLVAILSSAKGP